MRRGHSGGGGRRIVVATLVTAASVLGAACGDDTGPTPTAPTDGVEATTPSPSTTRPPSTTGLPSTTRPPSTTGASPSTSAPSSEATGALLLADEQGIRLSADGASAPVLTGVAVERAFPDRRGGVLFQPLGDEPPTVIELLATPGSEPEVFFEAPTARYVQLEDVTSIEGRPVAVVRVFGTPSGVCDPGDDACVMESEVARLLLVDVASRAETDLGRVGSFESAHVAVAIGEGVVVVSEYGYADEYWCVARTDLGWLLDGAAPDRWLGEGIVTRDHAGFPQCCPLDGSACTDVGPGATGRVAVAADGSRIAVVRVDGPTPDGGLDAVPVLEVTDAAGGAVVLRVDLDLLRGHGITTLAIDGAVLIGNHAGAGEPSPPVVVRPDGTVATVDTTGWVVPWVGPTDALDP